MTLKAWSIHREIGRLFGNRFWRLRRVIYSTSITGLDDGYLINIDTRHGGVETFVSKADMHLPMAAFSARLLAPPVSVLRGRMA